MVLLREHRGEGHLARFLIERSEPVATVFGGGDLEALLTEVYRDPATAYDCAGRSYLESGYFEEAEAALGNAIAHGGDAAVLEPLTAYARGMAAYLKSDYAGSITELSTWAETDPQPDSAMAERAAGAVAKVDQLVVGEGREAVIESAAVLGRRLADLRPAGAPVG